MPEILEIELLLRREWEVIDVVRRSLGQLVGVALPGIEPSDSISTACAELLENAVKYGSGEEVQLSLRADASAIHVRLVNALEPGSDHADVLRERMASLSTLADATVAYLPLLEQFYANPERAAEASGLGLARVRHECGCELSCEIDERVAVIARLPLDPVPA
jgi:anti-sigma regulatory factor (Ser/Thr protein kinase)